MAFDPGSVNLLTLLISSEAKNSRQMTLVVCEITSKTVTGRTCLKSAPIISGCFTAKSLIPFTKLSR